MEKPPVTYSVHKWVNSCPFYWIVPGGEKWGTVLNPDKCVFVERSLRRLRRHTKPT